MAFNPIWQKINVKVRNKIPTILDVAILEGSNVHTIVMRERSDNPGMSITNASEDIATFMISRLPGIHPSSYRWIEHYNHDGACDPTWDEVTYTWMLRDDGWNASNPVWRRVPGLEASIGEVMQSNILNDIVDHMMGEDNG